MKVMRVVLIMAFEFNNERNESITIKVGDDGAIY
jgi:hypothetical protein